MSLLTNTSAPLRASIPTSAGQFDMYRLALPSFARTRHFTRRSIQTAFKIPAQTTICADRSWLISKWVDLLFVSGLAPWIAGSLLFFIVNFASASSKTSLGSGAQQVLTFLFVGASLVIGESHQFTSIIRHYKSTMQKRDFFSKRQIPFHFVHILLIQILLASLSTFAQNFLSWTSPAWDFAFRILIVAFPAVLLHHVSAQALAIVQIYCRNAGFTLCAEEKGALQSVSWLLIATGACSIAIPFAFSTSSFTGAPDVDFPVAQLAAPLAIATAIGATIVFAYFICRGLSKQEWPPLGAAVLWLNLTLFVLLALPLHAMTYVWLFIPLLFHATQHWILAWHTQMRELPDPASSAEHTSVPCELFKLAGPVLLTTMLVLFFPLIARHWPPLFSRLAVFFTGATLSVPFSMAVFYMHYFADRNVWRTKT